VVNPIPLKDVKDWTRSETEIHHSDGKFFRIIAVHAEIDSREVTQWSQPMVEPAQEGLCAFLTKRIHGVHHFLVQGKVECGNFDTVEMAPTVQCLTGNYRETGPGKLPFLDYVLNADPDQIRYDAMQSEEGGRFFREQNRNLIIETEEDFPLEVPRNYIWMTLDQIKTFLMFNNYLNVQARSLISAIGFSGHGTD
jgi:oxidase EvaA